MVIETEPQAQKSPPISSFLEEISLFRAALFILILICLNFLSKYVKIWLYLRRLKRKGAATYLKIPSGIPARLKSDTIRNGDPYFWEKSIVKQQPNIRMIATHFGTKPAVYLVDPNLIKNFLSNPNRYKKSRVIDPIGLLARTGLVFANGDLWKRHKRIISENFQFEFYSNQIPKIISIANHVMETMFAADSGKKIDLLQVMLQITARVVFELFFGQSYLDAQIDGLDPIVFLHNLLGKVTQTVGSLENLLLGVGFIQKGFLKRNRELLADIQKFNAYCHTIIDNRRKEISAGSSGHSEKDFLGIMLRVQQDNKDPEHSFTDEEILHEFITFLIAGNGTTARSVTFASYFFSRESKPIKDEILKEAARIVKEGVTVTIEQINQAEMISAFTKETLRLAGPLPTLFLREALNDHTILDVPVSKGGIVTCSFVTNNFNSKYYKNPEKFNLYRWIKGHPDFEDNSYEESYIFNPFSGGPRKCIGKLIGLLETKLVFSIFLTKYRFTIPDDYKLRFSVKLSYEPANPILIDVCPTDAEEKYRRIP